MTDKPTLHLIGIFHTVHSQEYSHCAFTGKALRFSKMLQMYGYNVVEYANEGSESEAGDKVQILSRDELATLTGKREKTEFYANLATMGTPWHSAFEAKLLLEMQKRVKKNDIICHPFGHAHTEVCRLFPSNIHVETGIGYPTLMDGSFKIFESYAWRHYHAGKANQNGTTYEWVIPNYFEIDDWQPKYEPGQYYAFLGRISECKGLDIIYEIAKYIGDKKIVLCGQGDHKRWEHPNIEYWGPISGTSRSLYIQNAICSLMPTRFVEPFGGSGVEGLLCGTPLVAVDYGAFSETVQPGVNGFRCKTLRDWLEALENVPALDRQAIAEQARAKYSLQACGKLYDQAFSTLFELYSEGWYTLPEHFKRLKKEKS